MTEAVTRPTPGTPCWVSLIVHDLAASQAFYHELFDWEFVEGPPQLGAYVRARRNGRAVAGLGEMAPGAQQLVGWLPYLATDDADSTATTIRDCGGTLAVGPLEVAHVGRLAIAADVSGAAFGLWQAGGYAGAPFRDEPGTPVWASLITNETSGVGKFYSTLFGFDALPDAGLPPASDHLTLSRQGRPVARIEGVGADVPHDRGPHWLTHFAVANVDEAAERVAALGGRVLAEPADTPLGRMARVADPEGAPFAVLRPAAAG